MRIFVPLLNEGTEVWRPVEAEHVGEDRYRIWSPQPEHEDWPVASGDIVKCKPQKFASGEIALVVLIPG